MKTKESGKVISTDEIIANVFKKWVEFFKFKYSKDKNNKEFKSNNPTYVAPREAPLPPMNKTYNYEKRKEILDGAMPKEKWVAVRSSARKVAYFGR